MITADNRCLSGFGKRAHAGSTKALGNSLTIFRDIDLLNVDIPAAAGCFLGPGAIVAKLRPPPTALTLSHDTILSTIITLIVFDELITMLLKYDERDTNDTC